MLANFTASCWSLEHVGYPTAYRLRPSTNGGLSQYFTKMISLLHLSCRWSFSHVHRSSRLQSAQPYVTVICGLTHSMFRVMTTWLSARYVVRRWLYCVSACLRVAACLCVLSPNLRWRAFATANIYPRRRSSAAPTSIWTAQSAHSSWLLHLFILKTPGFTWRQSA